ncbi:ABC transporter permease [Accumulibacter sp.]|uniref:ABC transporter permease n=1 Tax=Accumulibacter sp. TaxID=2053492 RepID=UPI0028C37689|nr:ABC transporter permease [Accumulibacter sp.]
MIQEAFWYNARMPSPDSILSYLFPWRQTWLLRQFVQRQVEARYRGSVLGIGWSLLNPLLQLAVYTFIFRHVFRMHWVGSTGSVDFGLRLFAGMVVFGLFAECVMRAPNLIFEQPHLVKKVRFPTEILSWASLISALFPAALGLLLLLFVCMLMGIFPNPAWIALPLIWLPLLPLLLGLGWLLSAMGVYLRDLGQVLGIVVTMLQFLSPIFYPISALPAKVQTIAYLNPLALIIEQSRAAIFAGEWPAIRPWLIEMTACMLLATGGAMVFRRLRKGFADVV